MSLSNPPSPPETKALAMDPEDWSIDANEAVTFSLYSPETGKEIASNIHPIYTYPLFGENETIFGYKDLKIRIMFAADNMMPCTEITYAEKVKKVGEVEAEDIVKILKEYVPEKAFTVEPPAFIQTLRDRKPLFIPPGKKVSSYALPSSSPRATKTYEIFHSALDSAPCRALLENMQVLVSLYIEGGTPLDLEDEEWVNQRWEVFFLYEKTTGGTYSFIGYCTLYRHFYFDKSASDLSRVRLSQFLILPPYQKQGLGSRFYSHIVSHYLSVPEVRELTVEDPSEPFSDLRDIRDLDRVRRDPEFATINVQSIAKGEFPEEKLRSKFKMPKRQFARMMELELLKSVNKKEKKAYKDYRLFVKKRIYKQNIDVLGQLDRLERIDKLEETYFHVEDDYYRLLKAMKTRRVEDDEDAVKDDVENGRKAKRVKFQ